MKSLLSYHDDLWLASIARTKIRDFMCED